jgi:hypothetical protein
MTTISKSKKGAVAEEALRAYFISLGYFAVRGLPFNYKGFDVTDVDLWLYMKTTTLTREMVCVDVKRKKTPQAMERVLWTKGLCEVLGVDRAVVVTTDNRRETREFGACNAVTVLHGNFLQRVITRFSNTPDRIAEEQLVNDLKRPCVLDAKIVWTRFYRAAKATLLSGLNFNGCNQLLTRIHFLMQEYLATNKSSMPSIRLLYLLTSYLLIAFDYSSRLTTHLDMDLRKMSLAEGFRYGDAGRARAEEIVDTALQLLVETSTADLFSRAKLKNEVDKQLSEYPAEMMAEYFSKPEALKRLFVNACEFEKAAYASQVIMPHQCSSEQKAVLGLLCDFLKIDRRQII